MGSEAKIGILFGATSPKLKEQIPALDDYEGEFLQRCADAITLLSVRGLITERDTHKARQRLMKDIAQVLASK